MATIVLSAVGAAAGASIGGGIMGLSSVVIGRAIGASLGRVIDQRIMGGGSQAVETQRVERFRIMGAGEGDAIAHVYGRMRLGGNVIWASRFLEHVSTSTEGGGKGNPAPATTTTVYSYTVSLAVAICEGEISRIGRVWADGREIASDQLNMRVYKGTRDQLPDPKIEAVEGAGRMPGFRGIAYVVFEDLELGQFGNRVPQFSFEVFRPHQEVAGETPIDPANGISGVALIPGSGEYAMATSPVYFDNGNGKVTAANLNSPSNKTDFVTSVDAMAEEMPNLQSVSLINTWFADDLRISDAEIRPKVEQADTDSDQMPWRVSGETRVTAALVPQKDGRPVFGGTPSDQSVVEAIQHLKGLGKQVVFYPFILMDQLDGNGLSDPWSGSGDQPALPWRGRMTLSVAPTQSGTPDATATADAEVAAFFGSAQVGDFSVSGDEVSYTGPTEWSYRRFILHQAWLCNAAGGVGAFCIGSEMRGLTQIRGASGFPAVAALRALAADVRSILGTGTKIGYAADWSEYFGYQSPDGNLYFHLDDLWSDPEIDFIGIDNYTPLADWRDGDDHADAGWGAIYNEDYLKANILGGEGFDWYYASDQHRDAQIRTPITDGAYGEPWVWRYKDFVSWWGNAHFERIGGVRQSTPTSWVPQSKPIWFTELGCAAIDKGANEPNKFLDPKSSESSLPRYSNGRRDDLMQMQYLRAMFSFWDDAANNPISSVYGGPMVDMSNAHVWAWDTRPYPFFPNQVDVWSDGDNYFRGHWLNGRVQSRSLGDVVEEICARSGVRDVDVSGLYGLVRGYSVDRKETARASIQPLALAYNFDAIEREGILTFQTRDGKCDFVLESDEIAALDEQDAVVERIRVPDAETAGAVKLTFVGDNADYAAEIQESVFPDGSSLMTSGSEVRLLLTRTEARQMTERWLAETRVARDQARLALPMSRFDVGAGDVISLNGGETHYRVERVNQGNAQALEVVRVERETYLLSDWDDQLVPVPPYSPPVPVLPVFLDLPLMSGKEDDISPHLAIAAEPWPGSVAVYSSSDAAQFDFETMIYGASIVGTTTNDLVETSAEMVDRSEPLRVKIGGGTLSSVPELELLSGENLAAIGDGTPGNWELIQFRDATLVSPDTYDLSYRLRGRFGTDALASRFWPEGSQFVLLNGAARQVPLTDSERGLERYFRVGPSKMPHDDVTHSDVTATFHGIGLRPFAPAHLNADVDPNGDVTASWVRQTRIDGDNWASVDVPLGEDAEEYQLEVVSGASVVRTETLTAPAYVYSNAMQVADGVGSTFTIRVAQVSTRFGPGLSRRIDVNV